MGIMYEMVSFDLKRENKNQIYYRSIDKAIEDLKLTIRKESLDNDKITKEEVDDYVKVLNLGIDVNIKNNHNIISFPVKNNELAYYRNLYRKRGEVRKISYTNYILRKKDIEGDKFENRIFIVQAVKANGEIYMDIFYSSYFDAMKKVGEEMHNVGEKYENENFKDKYIDVFTKDFDIISSKGPYYEIKSKDDEILTHIRVFHRFINKDFAKKWCYTDLYLRSCKIY